MGGGQAAGLHSRGGLRNRLAHALVRLTAHVHPDALLLGRIVVRGAGRIEIGPDCVLDGRQLPIELHAIGDGVLRLGRGVRVGGGTSLESQQALTVADRVVIGRRCKIIDSHFHQVKGDRNAQSFKAETRLDEGCVLGDDVMVMAGAHVGARTRVSDRTVLSKPVPADVEVSGFPARVRPRG